MKKPKYTSVLIENVKVSVTGKYRIYRGNYSFYVVGRGTYHKCSTLNKAQEKIKELCLERRNFKKNKKKKEVEVWYARRKKP